MGPLQTAEKGGLQRLGFEGAGVEAAPYIISNGSRHGYDAVPLQAHSVWRFFSPRPVQALRSRNVNFCSLFRFVSFERFQPCTWKSAKAPVWPLILFARTKQDQC